MIAKKKSEAQLIIEGIAAEVRKHVEGPIYDRFRRIEEVLFADKTPEGLRSLPEEVGRHIDRLDVLEFALFGVKDPPTGEINPEMHSVIGILARIRDALHDMGITMPKCRPPLEVGQDVNAGTCDVCGGHRIIIRGRHPHQDNRVVCATCAVEKLEDIVSQLNCEAGTERIDALDPLPASQGASL